MEMETQTDYIVPSKIMYFHTGCDNDHRVFFLTQLTKDYGTRRIGYDEMVNSVSTFVKMHETAFQTHGNQMGAQMG